MEIWTSAYVESKAEETVVQRLQRLGLNAAASNVITLKLRKKKMMIAYEHYRYLTPEKIQAFQNKLQNQSTGSYYKRLDFTPLDAYGKVPPDGVLLKLEEALERKCFDQFEVAHIVQVKKDPLLLGLIEGCQDKFFIDQWDNDVKIDDILKASEG